MAVSMLERGARRVPRNSTIVRLADALRATADQRAALLGARRSAASEDRALATATRTLPRDLASFTGRGPELKRLLAAVADPGRSRGPVAISTISGMAGVGKTAFAVHAAHLLAPRFPDGQLFLDLKAHSSGQRPVAPADALASLLLSTGVGPRAIPEDLDARAALWRHRLAGRRMLVLLDDAAGHAQVRPLLPGAPDCLVLITSRRRLAALEDVQSMTLDTLQPDEAAELFTWLTGAPAGEELAGLMELCGCLPLAIGLLAGRFRSHPTWTLHDLTRMLRDAQNALLELRAESVAVEFAFSLSYEDLSADLRRLFRRLGLHPGRDLDAYAAAALDGADVRHTRRALEGLYDHHMIDEPRPGRYRLHDLVRAYARTLASRDEPAATEAALDRLFAYYLRAAGAANRHVPQRSQPAGRSTGHAALDTPDLSGRREAMAWLEAERANMGACVDYAAAHSRPVDAVRLAHAMHPVLVTGQAVLAELAAAARSPREG